jgi:uncharacterized Ntn-hydrolase superfamily protein
MRFLLFLSCWLLGASLTGIAQDTFSIVAVDSATGQVGSAGASCLDNDDITGGVYIITELLPGRGAINTQAQWNPSNQSNARRRMESGDSPQEILDWLSAPLNDAGFNPEVRQYGIADFDTAGRPRAAAFTGAQTIDWKGHRTGTHYAIQGNILRGPDILDSMQARFLRSAGRSLAERLMAALQGGNVPGADSRCLSEGVSSQSAFVRVAEPNDSAGHFLLDLKVTKTPFGREPIDSLQKLFDAWRLGTGLEGGKEVGHASCRVVFRPNENFLAVETPWAGYRLWVYEAGGRLLGRFQGGPGSHHRLEAAPDNLFFRLQSRDGAQVAKGRVEKRLR